ncbi:MAG: phage terminase small subunit P27 family [Beijerinckiaceae bacterium]
MRGRKPKTLLTDASPIAADRAPPEWLPKEARSEWRRVLPILVDRGVLSEADLATFANYCAAVGLTIRAQKQLDAEGLTFDSPTGRKRHPAAGIVNEAMTQARQLAAELGLTPVSRARPAIREGSKDETFMDL